MTRDLKVIPEKKAGFILAIAGRIVPEIASLDDRERRGILRVIDDSLASREPVLRMQFMFFLTMIRLSTLPRYARTLDRLAPEIQDRMLHKFEDSPIPRLRIGMWGLKTLVFMGYYGKYERAVQLGYTPSLKGNEKLGED